MKIIFLFLFLITGSISCALSQSQPLTSCDDLGSVADSLDDIADAMDSGLVIREDNSIDQILADLTDDIHQLTLIENDYVLTSASRQLTTAWDNQNSAGFTNALDNLSGRIDQLRARDCQ